MSLQIGPGYAPPGVGPRRTRLKLLASAALVLGSGIAVSACSTQTQVQGPSILRAPTGYMIEERAGVRWISFWPGARLSGNYEIAQFTNQCNPSQNVISYCEWSYRFVGSSQGNTITMKFTRSSAVGPDWGPTTFVASTSSLIEKDDRGKTVGALVASSAQEFAAAKKKYE
jgi:hypothetical protein